MELSKGPNKGITLVRYYPWCEVEPSDSAMKQAFLKKNMNPNKRAFCEVEPSDRAMKQAF